MIASAGLARMATLSASTWQYLGIGVGVTTVNLGDTALESSLLIKILGSGTASAFTAYFKITFAKTEGNSASNVTEIMLFDTSVNGNACFRTVASTNTWTAVAKTSSVAMTVSTSIAWST